MLMHTDQWMTRYSSEFAKAYREEIGAHLVKDEFTHGDPNPFNFLVGIDDLSQVTLLDWDKAGRRDLLCDLFFFAHHVGHTKEEVSSLKQYALTEYSAHFGVPSRERILAIEKAHTLYTLHKISTLFESLSSHRLTSQQQEALDYVGSVFLQYYHSLDQVLESELKHHTKSVFKDRHDLVSGFSRSKDITSFDVLDSELWQAIAMLQTPADDIAATRARQNVNAQIYSLVSKRDAMDLSFRVAGYSHFGSMVMIAPVFAEFGFDTDVIYKSGVAGLVAGLLVGGGARKIMDLMGRK